jgi:putative ATP-dependent endonuclease of OLD family
MHIAHLSLQNFLCFGPEPVDIELEAGLTAFIGTNGSGKTAACRALLRLFGLSEDERRIRPDDFHVPLNEEDSPERRMLRIEALLGFPELENDDAGGKESVPEFFHRMAAASSGALKCRIVLEATWEADGTLDGSVTETRQVVRTLDADYDEDDCVPFPPAERARIQMIYVPASRDGVRQTAAFLRGRLWRAAKWSEGLRETVTTASATLAETFRSEPATSAVEAALATRWQELHDADTHATPRFRPLESDFAQLLRNSELVFEPDPTGKPRPARHLSDGQRSLLHLALLGATLDIEAEVARGAHAEEFDLGSAHLPCLTLVAAEEPENSLAPFFLSRIISQLQGLSAGSRAQVVVASQSASILHRIEPEHLRYFRTDNKVRNARVQRILLPDDKSDVGKYVREAVRAHPELYFAKFVVLGEGDSEELVIPRIAQACGVALDPSFVAMVPLGGRHTNHFWRLLQNLGIPYATLLDLDYGREGGGGGRVRDAFARLTDYGVDVFSELEDISVADEITDDLGLEQLVRPIQHLRKFRVFFSEPLDLDYAMLTRFPAAYTKLEQGERGPNRTDPRESVLGKHGLVHPYWNSQDAAVQQIHIDALLWYRYLFLGRSKPGSHLRALANLTDKELHSSPETILALISTIRTELQL